MKNVNKVLAKRLKSLEKPFSREWLSDCSSLMQFIQTNAVTMQVLETIQKERKKAHKSLNQNLNSLFLEGNRCLQEINLRSTNDVSAQIVPLLKFKVNPQKMKDPFFELETVYREYYVGFVSILCTLAQSDENAFISNYCILSCMKLQDTVHLNIEPTFSPYLQKCKQDIEILSGQRASSQWGKWDMLLRWAEWTKNGISSSNNAFKRNLLNLFRGLKISETVQSCGLFFLEQLANMQILATTTETGICLKALELFLDQDDRYWIITHFSGENSEKRAFFIKRLQREAQSYALLQLLLGAEPYSLIEFPKLVHTLGELEIKNELKKVFFPHVKFAGSYVQLGQIDVSIDATSIVKHLSSIEEDRKSRPSFNWGYYHRSSYAYV